MAMAELIRVSVFNNNTIGNDGFSSAVVVYRRFRGWGSACNKTMRSCCCRISCFQLHNMWRGQAQPPSRTASVKVK